MAANTMPATNIDVAAFATSLNDATRALYGGLWSQTANEGNQGAGSLARYQADLATIKTDLANDHSAQATAIQNDIATALNAAPNTIGNGAGVAAAQSALQTAHLDILAQAAMDPLLANAGVTAAPTALNNAAAAPHATFADLGALFNDVVAKSLGGVNATTAPALNAELATIQSGLQTLIQNDAKDFNGLTAVHAQTIANQLGLEQTYNSQAGSSSIAARGPNDNLLDIVDIVQGDDVLLSLADKGWSVSPEAAKATTPYQDNAAQTNFWAGFVAASNSLGQQAEALVGSGNAAAIAKLTGQLHNFETNTQAFDTSQGGIFAARFDNELKGNQSTTGAEVNALIQGLMTGDKALVTAAAAQMTANAADVSSNNVPVGGGTFNTDATTAAQALSAATGLPANMAAAPDLTAAPGAAVADMGGAGNGGAAAAGGGMAAGGAGAGGAAAGGMGAGHGFGHGAGPGVAAGGAGAGTPPAAAHHPAIADALHPFDPGQHHTFHHMWG